MVEGSPTCPVTSDRQSSPPDTSLSLARGGSGAALLPSLLKSQSVKHTLDSWDSVLEANACSSYLPQAEFTDIHTLLAWTIIWKQKLRKRSGFSKSPEFNPARKLRQTDPLEPSGLHGLLAPGLRTTCPVPLCTPRRGHSETALRQSAVPSCSFPSGCRLTLFYGSAEGTGDLSRAARNGRSRCLEMGSKP